MGEEKLFQPLTKEDKVTVVIYRIGIALSTIIISLGAYMMLGSKYQIDASTGIKFNALLASLYVSVGLSVFFIHLYISKFKRALIKIYLVSLICLIILLAVGKGNALSIVTTKPYGPLLLIPLSLCLGFITAKEAFCFRLIEGYLLAMAMPFYLFLFSLGVLTIKSALYLFMFIAAMLIIFTFRKVFMPIHYDIGDKSAYT